MTIHGDGGVSALYPEIDPFVICRAVAAVHENNARHLIFLLVLLICLACTACEHEEEGTMFPIKTEMKTDGQLYRGGEVEFPDSLWQTPAFERYEELDYEERNIRAYFLDSVQDTKVFAFVGIPKGASAENKVPGIVLVHGGYGTASRMGRFLGKARIRRHRHGYRGQDARDHEPDDE